MSAESRIPRWAPETDLQWGPRHLDSHQEKTTGTSGALTIWLCCSWNKLLVRLARGEDLYKIPPPPKKKQNKITTTHNKNEYISDISCHWIILTLNQWYPKDSSCLSSSFLIRKKKDLDIMLTVKNVIVWDYWTDKHLNSGFLRRNIPKSGTFTPKVVN